MAIERFYNENFLVHKRTESKVNGKLSRVYAAGVSYTGALFTPSVERTVRWDKQDFVISKNLYCSVDTDIELGDRVTYNSEEFDVIYKENTNAQNHHLNIGLVSR